MKYAKLALAGCGAGLILAASLGMNGLALAGPEYDPVTMDPPQIDAEHPPAVREVSFESHGDVLSGLVYLAGGAGPHPSVVLLHGLPGNEKNLDLAQVLRRGGWNVLFFHYRGAWGSEGTFGFRYSRQDVGAALAFLRANAETFRVDTDRLALVGHSMGGYMALYGAAVDKEVRCIVAISPVDLGANGLAIRKQREDGGPPPVRSGTQKLVMLDGSSRPLLNDELAEFAEELALAGFAAGLEGKKLLLTAGARDAVLPPPMHKAIKDILQGVPGLDLTVAVLDADHSYSWKRLALSRRVNGWLDSECK